MATSVQEDVVWLDITADELVLQLLGPFERNLPVNEAKLVHSLDSQNDLRHVEPCDVFTKDLVLDEHSHQVTTRQELHQHVQEGVVLEGGVQLDDPGTVRFGENITFGTHVGQLIFLKLCRVNSSFLAIVLWR